MPLPTPPPIPEADERWLDLGGHRQRYLVAGSGPPLVLLHGLLGYSFSWRLNYAALGNVATLYAPDALGTGFSERVADLDCSLQGSAGRVLAFMDALGLRDADLLGTSHGGAVAVFAAALDREQGSRRIRRLLLVDAVNPWSRYGRWLIRVLGGPIGRALPWAAKRFAPTHSYWLRRQYADPRRIPAGTLAGYTAPLEHGGTMEHAHAILRCWRADLRDYEARLALIRDLPTLLLWGSKDAAVLPTSAHEVAKRLDRAELVMLDGVGHLPYEESPEEFNRVVMAFLQKQETTQARSQTK
jgi:pimeloyl-ACP methyl ester carboxylesterase